MKLKISLVSLLLAFVAVTFAQEPKTYTETAGYKNAFLHNGAGSNWFIQLGVGGQVLVAENIHKSFFDFKQVTLAPTLSVGKWFNPWLGLRLTGQGGCLNSFPAILNGKADYDYKQEDKYFAGHFDLMWNVSNYWGKYNAKRVFSFIPYIGLGGYYRFEQDEALPLSVIALENQHNESTTGLTINAGLLFQFRLSDRVGFHIDLAGLQTDDHLNRIIFDDNKFFSRYEGIASVTAGFTFNLGKTYFEPVDAMDYGLINDLNRKINELRAENDLLSKRPVKCDPCPEVQTAPASAIEIISNIVLFRLNSSVVDANQQVNIYNTAQFVKGSGEKIKVIGYADKQTGTGEYNLKLSEKRAKAVAKELISKYGIASEKIVVEWKGSNEQPYKENNWNRVVIMSTR